MAKSIMLMGTSSHVGKSILTTALCRIFWQKGRRVVPFKAQNMALNSYVTLDGREMGRAQVAQAEAAGLAPMVDMNPVLLKPTGNSQSQVVIMGEPVGNMSAREYHKGYSLKAWGAVEEALDRLRAEYKPPSCSLPISTAAVRLPLSLGHLNCLTQRNVPSSRGLSSINSVGM